MFSLRSQVFEPGLLAFQKDDCEAAADSRHGPSASSSSRHTHVAYLLICHIAHCLISI